MVILDPEAAAKVLALSYPDLAARIVAYQAELVSDIVSAGESLQ